MTSPLAVGEPYTLSMTARNNGPVDAGHFFVQFYLSSDRAFSPDDVAFAFCDYPRMPAGASGPCSFTVNFGTDTPVAAVQYHVIGIVDNLGEVAESNEANNVFVTEALTVN